MPAAAHTGMHAAAAHTAMHSAAAHAAVHAASAATAVKRQRRRCERERRSKRTGGEPIDKPLGHLNSSVVEVQRRMPPLEEDEKQTQTIQ
jgi:hypothetical protein